MEKLINEIFNDSIIKLKESQLQKTEIKKITISKDFFDADYCNDFKKNFKSEILKNQIEILVKQNIPVLYWFTFDESLITKELIRDKFVIYKTLLGKSFADPNYRHTSALKENFFNVKNVLYVGKVEKGFLQRVTTHLGYAKSKFTAGMQLYHWYEIENFGDLTLNYITFNNDMKYLITILEKHLAIQLNPLIGKY